MFGICQLHNHGIVRQRFKRVTSRGPTRRKGARTAQRIRVLAPCCRPPCRGLASGSRSAPAALRGTSGHLLIRYSPGGRNGKHLNWGPAVADKDGDASAQVPPWTDGKCAGTEGPVGQGPPDRGDARVRPARVRPAGNEKGKSFSAERVLRVDAKASQSSPESRSASPASFHGAWLQNSRVSGVGYRGSEE